MLRFINTCLVVGLVALAYVIYQVKYETRGLDRQIASIGKEIEAERDAVAVLRAEWSLLNRPERIERLAKKHLKLAPSEPRQLVTLDKVTDRDFERSRDVIAPPAKEAPAAKPTVMAGPPTKPAAGAEKAAAPPANVLLPWSTATVVETPAQ
jgi:cell division protein FtsL